MAVQVYEGAEFDDRDKSRLGRIFAADAYARAEAAGLTKASQPIGHRIPGRTTPTPCISEPQLATSPTELDLEALT